MTKKEIIWRFILHETLVKRRKTFTQKDIAQTFGVSTSTVFHALQAPRKLGAVEVTGRFFRLRDVEKLLLLWATQRNLKNDIFYSTSSEIPVREIEGSMPPDVVFAAFSAYRLAYHSAPADYDAVYVYSDDMTLIKKRFPKSPPRFPEHLNLFILKPDPYLHLFGQTTPDVQTFVDLWNLPQWYAKDFLNALKEKLHL